ncbi:septum formation initiator family protein [Rhodococcus sp. HNM0569]|uniref:FtsB family cell division protein n=1 Tax=Rhodococcus sp. HNM0569 TaxID=2716340 RepID=UPI003211DE5F
MSARGRTGKSDTGSGTVLPGRARPRRVGGGRGRAPIPERTILGLSTGRALILAVVVLVLALTLAVPLRTYLTQRSDLERVATERAQLERELDELRKLEEKYTDPAYIDTQARQRLRFVRPGETPYQVQLPGDYREPEPVAAEESRSPGPWYSDLWQSVARPDASTEPPPPPPMPLEPAEPEDREQGEPTG